LADLRSFFFSDLHLLANRSSGPVIAADIFRATQQAHTMVLGGDIFDFKWSTLASLQDSIEDSIRWLERLIDSQQRCMFYYVLGNHDAHPSFVAALDRLAFRQPRLVWQPYVIRLDHCVFLHGDVVDCEPNEESIAASRRRIEDRPFPARSKHLLYDAVVRARLHRVVVQLAVRPSTVLRKLAIYLSSQGLTAENGVKDVYFGHTHRDVDGLCYQGMTFHNGGASIKGLSFRIVETSLPVLSC
jgi:UDP-2,3-diacylglucosamine pyrophosphatase LpxH